MSYFFLYSSNTLGTPLPIYPELVSECPLVIEGGCRGRGGGNECLSWCPELE